MYDTCAQITNKYKTFSKTHAPFVLYSQWCLRITMSLTGNNSVAAQWHHIENLDLFFQRISFEIILAHFLLTTFWIALHFLTADGFRYSLTLITSIICIKRMDSLVCCSERSLSWCMYSLHHKLYFSANIALTFICRVYFVLCLSSYFLFLPVFLLYLALLAFFLYAVSCCLWLALQCSLLTVWIMTSSLPTSL